MKCWRATSGKKWRSLKARRRAAVILYAIVVGAAGVPAQRGPAAPRMEAFWDRVHKGNDIGWLEQIASSPEFLCRGERDPIWIEFVPLSGWEAPFRITA